MLLFRKVFEENKAKDKLRLKKSNSSAAAGVAAETAPKEVADAAGSGAGGEPKADSNSSKTKDKSAAGVAAETVPKGKQVVTVAAASGESTKADSSKPNAATKG